MRSVERTLQVYEDLARWYDRQGQAKLRDWFLVLAADTALASGRADEAERLRGWLLQVNPHHLLRPFHSFAEALKSPDVQGYVADLRRTYPPEAAAQLLKTQRGDNLPEEEPEEPPASAAEPVPAPPPPAAPEEPEVQVYRLQSVHHEEEPRLTPPPPRPVAMPRPETRTVGPALTSAPAPRPAPPRPTAAPPRPRPVAAQPAPWTAPPEPMPMERGAPLHESGESANRLVASTLFLIVLVGGLALLGHVLVRPFLPGQLF